jgi:hypothetical protein
VLIFKDFRKLLIVCLKMLFRKTTRKRFIFLVAAFMLMMGFNTYSYVMRFHKTETQKRDILNEKAFKLFFLRTRTSADCARFLAQNEKRFADYGSEIVREAFIYQNNLYIHFRRPSEFTLNDGNRSLDLLYDLFNIKRASEDFFLNPRDTGYEVNARADYFDHNGVWLSDDILRIRHKGLRQDLLDIADMIREGLSGKRLEIYNSIRNTIIDNIKRVPLQVNYEPNPYLSRVENIVPMNFLYILTNIREDNSTDIMDLGESVRYEGDGSIKTVGSYMDIPSQYNDKPLYDDMAIYPRYIPIYAPELLRPRWNLLLYEDIYINSDFMDYIEKLHFKGNYMFSYEKSHIIEDKVKKINDDIYSNHIFFYLTDLSVGIAFPFMISLFAFIHLKTEISFLFMFKNRIRELLFIFWLMPVFLMSIVKGGILAGYLIYLNFLGYGISSYIVFSLLITFLLASIFFYPINRWCFSQFTGEKINLYALHKGR